HTCVYRWLWRRMRYAGRVAPGLPAGCRQELLPGARFREILRYVLRFRRKQRPRIVDRLERVDGGQRVIALRTPREVDDFLAAL
ncbi:MAG TPA: hypothetical protein VFV99_02450, partial [Kofleriaceae bacterium]|nr:hypothetical protein [Kofleriaceae bacterium]